MMELSGQIIKINEELNYGFVSVKGHEDVFFSPNTEYISVTFGSLKVGDRVKIHVKNTERGLLAVSIAPASS